MIWFFVSGILAWLSSVFSIGVFALKNRRLRHEIRSLQEDGCSPSCQQILRNRDNGVLTIVVPDDLGLRWDTEPDVRKPVLVAARNLSDASVRHVHVHVPGPEAGES